LFGFIQHKMSPVVADDPEQPVAVEVIPSVRGGYSAIASGNAPFVYFENAPFFALMNGVGNITLDASRMIGVDSNGKVLSDKVIIAHLRGNLLALRSLRDALDAVLLMAEPSPGDSLN
jgi:hypothetical protein